ncbi:MAG: dihydrofolate reductase [Longicatena caecimuris]
MGRETWEAMESTLPQRHVHVLTRNPNYAGKPGYVYQKLPCKKVICNWKP